MSISEAKSSVVLVSGGIDSATLLYHLKDQGHHLKALSFDYGQKHKKELDAAKLICAELEVPHKVIDISSLKEIFRGSSLTTDKPVPHGHYTDSSMKDTIVPNRNMIFISIATAVAISEHFANVAYAAHAGDHTIYPDCREEFASSLEKSLLLCDWSPIHLLRPFVGKTKGQIVENGSKLGVPFNLTWSCYEGGELHCGRCGTCVERKEAFNLAKIDDPTRYRD